MKKQLLTIAGLLLAVTLKAQTLPKEVVIKLTDKQVLRLDSAVCIVSSQIDSKSLTQYLNSAIEPIFNQVRLQLVAEKPKEITKPIKP